MLFLIAASKVYDAFNLSLSKILIFGV